VFANFIEPNCVNAWDKLDSTSPTNDDCCVTLGHVRFIDPTTIESTAFFRQGVSPRFNVIRNTDGTPSIFLTEARFDPTPLGPIGEPITTQAAVGIPVATFFGPGAVNFNGPLVSFGGATFQTAGGLNLQATNIAPFGASFQTGTFWPQDPRVFVFSGGSGVPDVAAGTSELPAGLAGLSAVPCELFPEPALGPVDRAGLPLAIVNDLSTTPRVHRTVGQDLQVIGLSAGPQAVLNGKLVVPVAVAGLLKATVTVPSGAIGGQPLTVDDANRLKVCDTPGQFIVARVAAFIPVAPQTEAFVWVQHPSVRFESLF
jgi:hypothetical protein